MTLLILAGGIGSRFGGFKQLEPLGPNGEYLIEYSIYDAIKAGFKKVIFVINDRIYDLFKETIGKRIEKHIEVVYIIDKEYDFLKNGNFNRVKPWGTGYAIMLAKRYIDGNFMVINADDFYGCDSYIKGYQFLKSAEYNEFGLIGFRADNAIPNGKFKRGVCVIEDSKLIGINESYVDRKDSSIICKSLMCDEKYILSLNAIVSMNMLLFTPKIFEFLSSDFNSFLDNIKDETTEEFLIPIVFDKHLRNKDISGKVIETNSIWSGITYKEDINGVKNYILELIEKGDYNYHLWEKI